MATPSLLTREAGTSTPKRRPARRRLSLSHLLIGLVAALAFLFNYLALQQQEATTLVAVAESDIGAGTPLSADIVRMVPVSADFEGADHLVTETGLDLLQGWTVARPLSAGEPLTTSDLVRGGVGDGAMAMSIPVAIEHAVGGRLSPGDRVDVLAVADGEAAFIARDLEVMGVADVQTGGLGGAAPFHLVVAVTAEQALAVATAIDQGSFEILRSTGSSKADR